jgi:hypothetical protein
MAAKKPKSKQKQSQRRGTAKINVKDDEAVAQRKAEIKSREARISHAPWWKQSKVEKEIAQEAIKGLKFKEVAQQKPGKRDEEYYKKQAEWEKHLASLKPNERIPFGGNSRRYEYLEGTYKTKGEMSDLKKDREAQLQVHLKKTPKMERWLKKAEQDVKKLQKQLNEAKTEKTKKKIERKLSARRKRMDELQKKRLSLDDAQRFNSYRSGQARKQDEKKRAKVVEDWRWMQAPDRFDYEGVDTPNPGRNNYLVNELFEKKNALNKKFEAKSDKRFDAQLKLKNQLDAIRMREQEMELKNDPRDIQDKKKRAKAIKLQAKEQAGLKRKKAKISERLTKIKKMHEKADERENKRFMAAQRAWQDEEQKPHISDHVRVAQMMERSREYQAKQDKQKKHDLEQQELRRQAEQYEKEHPRSVAPPELQAANKDWMHHLDEISGRESELENAFRRQKVVINPARSAEGYAPKYAGVQSKEGEKRIKKMKEDLQTAREKEKIAREKREQVYQAVKAKGLLPSL